MQYWIAGKFLWVLNTFRNNFWTCQLRWNIYIRSAKRSCLIFRTRQGNCGKPKYQQQFFWENLIDWYIPAVVIAFIMRCVLKCGSHIIRIRSNKQRWIRWGLSTCQCFREGFQPNAKSKQKKRIKKLNTKYKTYLFNLIYLDLI